MIATIWILSLKDLKDLKVKDEYSIHRIIYDLFSISRDEKQLNSDHASGILYVEKSLGSSQEKPERKFLILSDRESRIPEYGNIESKEINDKFLSHKAYRFQTIINPTKRDRATGKTVSIITRSKDSPNPKQQIHNWFMRKTLKNWGFEVTSLVVNSIELIKFQKKSHDVTLSKAYIQGMLEVKNQELFIESFKKGIGRGRSFGCGLIELVPIN